MISPDDPKLTAYALGELLPAERAAIEQILRTDPAARAAVEQIRTLAAQLTGALAHEASLPIEGDGVLAVGVNGKSHNKTEELGRAAIVAGYDPSKLDGGPLRRRNGEHAKLLQFPQLYFLIGGLAAACVAVIVSLTDHKVPQAKHYTVVNLGTPKSVAVTLPKASSTAEEPSAAGTPEEAEAARASQVSATAIERGTSVALAPALPVSREMLAGGETVTAQRDNPFLTTKQARWSTFGIDIDTTSYAVVRRYVSAGRLPPSSSVRVEELVNYFSTTAPSAAASAGDASPLAANLEVADAPWAPKHRLVRIGVKAREPVAPERAAANLVFLIDVSGSMDAPTKLPLVQQAMRLLLERLRPDDRVAIVTYAGTSGVVLPSTPVANSREIIAALDALTPAGATNGAIGLDAAYDIAKSNFIAAGINRVILCTDGDFNGGPTGENALARLVEERAKTGVTLTVLGFGMGREKDTTIELLAEKGRGSHGYVNTRREAEKVLAEQIGGVVLAAATDVKVQVDFNPAQVESYRLVGFEDRAVHPQDFADDKSRGSDMVAGQSITAVYEVVPVAKNDKAASIAKTDALLTFRLRYRDPEHDSARQIDFALADRGETFASASSEFKFTAAVAEFGMILRDSPYRGKASMGDVIAWASAAASKANDDSRGYRSEFVDLARRTQALLQ